MTEVVNMAFENCKRCGNLYNKTIKDICPKCVEKEEEDYKKVRIFLKRKKNVEMKIVSEETKVDLELIYQFLQDGRIVLSDGAQAGYPCKQCNTLIQTGSICTSCTNQLNEIQQSLQQVTSNTLHTSADEQTAKKGAFHARD